MEDKDVERCAEILSEAEYLKKISALDSIDTALLVMICDKLDKNKEY